MIMPYFETHSKTIALFTLLTYARTHYHSRLWIGPLTRLLDKGVRDA
jgi:hypothetical protein